MAQPLNVIIFSKGAGSQQYGLGQDARIIDGVLRELNATGTSNLVIKHKDPVTFVGKGAMPTVSDVHIYLEVPCRVAYPWAAINIVVPNPEWWYKNEWSWVLEDPSTRLFHRTRHSQGLFSSLATAAAGHYIGWFVNPVSKVTPTNKKTRRALYIVGGSVNKAAMAQQIINYWKPEYPELIVVASKELGAEFPPIPGNVSYKLGHLSNSEKLELQDSSMYHVTASSAEGYGYTMAEALSFGAIPIWTDLPVYKENWSGLLGDHGLIKTTATAAASDKLDSAVKITEDGLTACMNKLLAGSPKFKINFQDQCKIYIKELNSKFKAKFRETWLSTIASTEAKAVTRFAPPKMLPAADLPIVGVVTLFYNRPEWFSHAVRNLLTCDYPRDKLVWVIVDDSDAALRVDLKVEQARKQYPDLNIQYVSCSRRLSVGEKRNRGTAASVPLGTSVIAFMDDDDHYPKASLILRVLWLLNSKRGLVYCSTLPMYDITKYISAINVPPLNLSPSKRVSEASMCFTVEFWSKRKFPDISVAEGEGFIEGRELDTVEIPPEGVIVSFLHGKNSTSRRVPEQKEANGCHYGFSDEYFTMISTIAPGPQQ
jgi:hypothetical protein